MAMLTGDVSDRLLDPTYVAIPLCVALVCVRRIRPVCRIGVEGWLYQVRRGS